MGFAVGGLDSCIIGSGMGGGMFTTREIRMDSTKATLDIDCRMTWGGGFFCS